MAIWVLLFLTAVTPWCAAGSTGGECDFIIDRKVFQVSASFRYETVLRGTMDVLEALRTRRSIGKLDGDVSDADIRTLVEAALCAPNHKRTNPWLFTVVRGEARERLGRYWASLLSDAGIPAGIERSAFLEREARKPMRAPAIVVVSTRTDPDDVRAFEDLAAVAAATQNLLLAAHALGLGAVWRSGDMAYRPEINTFLDLDANDRIVAFVYLGQPAMPAPASQARDVDAYLRYVG
jgi:nitroreductase